MPVMRELLAHAVPSLHPRLFSMFDRLGPTARNLDVYRRLNDALHGPAAEAIFEADQVSDHLLSLLDRIAKDRVLWAARKAIGTSGYSEASLTITLAFLRAHGLAFAIETLPPGSGCRAVLRRLKARFWTRAWSGARIPTARRLAADRDHGGAMGCRHGDEELCFQLARCGEDHMRQFISGRRYSWLAMVRPRCWLRSKMLARRCGCRAR